MWQKLMATTREGDMMQQDCQWGHKQELEEAKKRKDRKKRNELE